jgi:hypothetical protein
MIRFYFHPTPNPAKVALFLEESASMAPGGWNGNNNDRAFPMVGVSA